MDGKDGMGETQSQPPFFLPLDGGGQVGVKLKHLHYLTLP